MSATYAYAYAYADHVGDLTDERDLVLRGRLPDHFILDFEIGNPFASLPVVSLERPDLGIRFVMRKTRRESFEVTRGQRVSSVLGIRRRGGLEQVLESVVNDRARCDDRELPVIEIATTTSRC
jgi:hypothetical protein